MPATGKLCPGFRNCIQSENCDENTCLFLEFMKVFKPGNREADEMSTSFEGLWEKHHT